MGRRYNRIKKLVREDRTPYTGTRDFNGGWRKKILSESDWTPVSGSIANSTSQPFVHPTGATTTVSGLGGVETTPSTVTIDAFGDRFDVPAPEYGQYGMQGYAKPLSKEVMKRNAAYEKELEEFRKKQDEQMDKIKSTLINLGTSWEELRANGWALIRDDGTSVMITPTSSNADMFNWTDNVEITVGRQHPDADGKPYKTVGSGGKNAVGSRLTDTTIHNSKVVKTIKLEIGEPPKRPSVNSQLDASQEFAQQVGADEFMNARVEPLSPSILPKQDAVLATLQYAFGLYDPKKKRKGGQTKELEKAMLNVIGNSIRRGDTLGRVDATQDYWGQSIENIPAQAFLNNFGYSITDRGIVVDDRFNFDDVLGTRIGGAFADNPLGFILNPAAQFTADRLVDLGDRVSQNIMGIDPRDDARAGFAVQYTIPWSRVPANHPAQELRGNVEESTTWSRINKFR